MGSDKINNHSASLYPKPSEGPLTSETGGKARGEIRLNVKDLSYLGSDTESISADSTELNDSFFTSIPMSFYSKSSKKGKRKGPCQKLWQRLSCYYLWKSSSLFAYAFRILFFFALIMIPGVVCHLCAPELTYEGHEVVFWSFMASFFLLFYFVVHWLMRALTMLGRRYHPHSELVFRIREAKSYISFLLYTIALAVLWNTSKLKNAYFLAPHFNTVNNFLFCLGASLIAFALKKALVSRIMLKFNHKNYVDRLRDVLFVEKALDDLSKSRQIEKSSSVATTARHTDASPSLSPSPEPALGPAPALAGPSTSSQPANDQSNLDAHARQDIYNFHKLVERVQYQYETMTAVSADSESSEQLAMQEWISEQSKRIAKKLTKWLAGTKKQEGQSVIRLKSLRTYMGSKSDCDRLWRMMVGASSSVADASSTDDSADPQPVPFYMSHHIGESDHMGLAAATKADEKPVQVTSLSEKELTSFINQLYQEILVLDNSLSSMAAAVAKLNIVLTVILLLVLMVGFAFLFSQWKRAVDALGGLLLSFSFIFGSTAKNLFECIIFLFVTHPFDVGDRIYMSLIPSAGPTSPVALPGGGALVTNAPGSGTLDNLVVVEMNLLTTVFERWDGGRVIAPNYALVTKPILNVRRSGALYETHKLQMDFATPMTKIHELKAMCETFVRDEANDYMGNYLVVTLDSFENMNRMHISVNVKHRTNWQDFEGQIMRKSKFLMFLKDCLEKLEIRYTPPDQRIEILPSYEKVVQKLAM